MINSVGIDLVEIIEFGRIIETCGRSFIDKTFTTNEIEQSLKAANRLDYLASRFAAKEAVFKAVAHYTTENTFDLRIIETLEEPDGFPRVHVCKELSSLLKQASISNIHISLSHDGGYAMAFAVAEKDSASSPQIQ